MLGKAARSVPVLLLLPLSLLIFVLTHSTTAKPQGRALISSPTLNKVPHGKHDSYGGSFRSSDDGEVFNIKPTPKKTSQQKNLAQHNDRRTYTYRPDSKLYDTDAAYEPQLGQNQQHPYHTDYKESFSRDDTANTNYGGLGVILGRQNPLRLLG